MNTERDVWMPEYETTVIEYLGDKWPDILVEKWERNGIGERRLVTSLIYRPPFATGGPVQPNGSYLVGESGAETVVVGR